MKFRIGSRELRMEFARPSAPAVEEGPRVQSAKRAFLGVGLDEYKLMFDDSVYSVYRLLCEITTGGGAQWEGADAEACSDITSAIVGADGWSSMVEALAGAQFTRFACAEIVWGRAKLWTPTEFNVFENNTVRMDFDEFGRPTGANILTTAGYNPLDLPYRVLHRYRPTRAQPLGTTVYDHLREVIQYKRRADLAILQFIERHSAPLAVGWYAPGTPKGKQQELLSALKAMVAAGAAVLPGPKGDLGAVIELLEASSSAGIAVAIEMIKSYERRIARAILGSVLAMFESEYGTRAQAETHAKIMQQVIRSFQAPIEKTINSLIVEPTLAYNRPGAAVRFRLVMPDFADPATMGQWVSDLSQAGVIDPEADGDLVRGLFGLPSRSAAPSAG